MNTNKKVIMGTLMCFSVIGAQNINIYANPEEIKDAVKLNKQELSNLRYIVKDKVPVKKINIEISTELGSLSKNDTVEVIDIDGEWAKIKYGLEGQIGYVKSKYLTGYNDFEKIMYVDNTNKIEVYKSPEVYSEKIASVNRYEKVKVLENLGNFIKIRYKNQVGYILNEKDTLVEQIKKRVRLNTALYSEKSELNQIGMLKRDEEVEIIEDKGNYVKINSRIGTGYINKEFLLDRKYINGKDREIESLRVSEGSNSDIRTYIPQGSAVEVESYSGNYVKIKYGEYEGYVNKDSLSEEPRTLKTEDLVGKYKLHSEYKIEDVLKEIKNLFSEEIRELRKSKLEDCSKEEKEILKKNITNKIVEKFKLEKINKEDVTEITTNYGQYYEVKINEKNYYVINEGLKSDFGMKYIHSLPSYETTSKTRFISKMSTTLYRLKNYEMKDDFKKEDLIELGCLVEDANVDLIKEYNNGYSLVKINGVRGLVESKNLSVTKKYTKVTQTITYDDNKKSHKDYVDSQMKNLNTVVRKGGIDRAVYEDIAYYSNPNKLSVWKNDSKYQYLRLDTFRNVNAYQLNEYLNSIVLSNGKKSVFKDMGDVFISAARKYNLDPLYLVSHSLLETGFGGSKLAQGINYGGKGKVYNLYGIGATDSNVINGGSSLAKSHGWDSIEAAIEGSAKWLSNNYIHHEMRCQNILYRMRYNYKSRTHQYASDVAWAYKISVLMNKLSYMYEDTHLEFEVPRYKKGTYVIKGEEKEESVINDDAENTDEIKPSKPNSPEKPSKPNSPEEVPEEKPTETPEEVPGEKPTETPEEVPEEKPTETPEEVPEEKPTETPEENNEDNKGVFFLKYKNSLLRSWK